MSSDVAEQWPMVCLSQIAELSLAKMLDKEKNKGELRPYLANMNVRWGSFDLQDLREMRFEERELERYGLRLGDIVMCEGGEPGRCAIWTDEMPGMMIQKALHRIRPTKGIDSYYLYYALAHSGRSGAFDEYMTGGGIKHLPGNQVAKVEVAFPPIDEQRRIAEVMRSVDEAIAATSGLVRQTGELWHTMAETAIWRRAATQPDYLRPLAQAISASDYGVNASLTSEPIGHAILRMGNIQDGQIDPTDMKWGAIQESEAKALGLDVGDILFNRTNSRDLVGKVALVREPTDFLYASYIVRLRVNNAAADPYYIFAVMHSRRAQAQFKSIATPGVSQSNINPTNLKKQLIPLLPLVEQREIAGQLQAVEVTRQRLLHELAALRQIKADVMSDLLTGLVRVPA